jgi:hypothetical protein
MRQLPQRITSHTGIPEHIGLFVNRCKLLFAWKWLCLDKDKSHFLQLMTSSLITKANTLLMFDNFKPFDESCRRMMRDCWAIGNDWSMTANNEFKCCINWIGQVKVFLSVMGK